MSGGVRIGVMVPNDKTTRNLPVGGEEDRPDAAVLVK